MLELGGTYGVHDPAIIEQDGVFYLYWTGGANGTRIPARTSNDLITWQNATGALGNSNPAWISQDVNGTVENLWEMITAVRAPISSANRRNTSYSARASSAAVGSSRMSTWASRI